MNPKEKTPKIMEKIEEVEINKKAKALGVSTEGKELQHLSHEARQAEMKEEAKALGIS